ncbi:unnamed protein product [Mytilus edulis]|uniref:Uncharacterized protein n=1 Tax=Mytilus edulis TaxID=6550 RepID=A0A8S3PNL1_MYTED|nr:unnamed protein product [Mytilus edulis]
MVLAKCLMFICIVVCYGQVHDLSIRKCKSVVDENYKVVELQCLYEGEGSYVFTGPVSVKKITLDRLAGSSTMMTFGQHLERVSIKTCTIGNCCQAISTSPYTEVQIADKICSLENLNTEDLVSTTDAGETSPHTEGVLLTPQQKGLKTTLPDHQQNTTENEANSTTPWIVATVTTLTVLLMIALICLGKKCLRNKQFQVLIFTMISVLVVLNRIHRLLLNAIPALRNFIPPVRQLINPPQHQPLHQAVQPIPPVVHQEVILPLPAPPLILRRSTRQSIPPNRLNL